MNTKETYFFTSEAVSEGHPDKICDQISDAILDFCLKKNPNSRVACEVFITNINIIVGGEITPRPKNEEIIEVVKKTLRNINYEKNELFSENNCKIQILIQEQSKDINKKVDIKRGMTTAGDQGIMFGYATINGPEYMPLPIVIANELVKCASDLRKKGLFKHAKPDMKSQVVVEYDINNKPICINSILMSIQHNKNYDKKKFIDFIKSNIIKETVNKFQKFIAPYDDKIHIFINPIGEFILGGPIADTGLTGRKIIVDTYGGRAKHGGGAFSGKDYTKVDRTASYMCRYVAKNIVAAKIAKEIEIEVSYIIGKQKPLSYWVDTKGTSKYSNYEIIKMIKKLFDFSTDSMIEELNLKKPIYYQTSVYGHFGKKNFRWEKLDYTKKIIDYFCEGNKKNEMKKKL